RLRMRSDRLEGRGRPMVVKNILSGSGRNERLCKNAGGHQSTKVDRQFRGADRQARSNLIDDSDPYSLPLSHRSEMNSNGGVTPRTSHFRFTGARSRQSHAAFAVGTRVRGVCVMVGCKMRLHVICGLALAASLHWSGEAAAQTGEPGKPPPAAAG